MKEHGIIYGSEPATGENKLYTGTNGGDAVYYVSTVIRKRNATLGDEDNISTDNLNENWDS